jgi:hypothetical protein
MKAIIPGLLVMGILVIGGCVSQGQEAPKPADAADAADKLALPDITGLAGPDAAAPETAEGQGKKVTRLSVLVDKAGKAKSEGEGAVKPWRGVNLPKDVGPLKVEPAGEAEEAKEYVVKLALADGKTRIEAEGKVVADFAALGKALADAKPKVVIVDAAGDVPAGAVVKTVAVAVERKIVVEFRAPAGRNDKGRDEALRKLLAAEAAKRGSPDGLSELGLRIRADERAPWTSVQELLMACMMAKMWRFSFAAELDGKEVVVGWVEGKAPKHNLGGVIREKPPEVDPAKKPDIFKNPGDDGAMMVGVFGYRDGGGRKKAVGRFGGSQATESGVEAALRWLARHQKADGSWDGEVAAVETPPAAPELPPEEAAEVAKLIGRLGDNDFDVREAATKALAAKGKTARGPLEEALKSPDAEVRQRAAQALEEMVVEVGERAGVGQVGCTGLALLAFLGAGYTDTNGLFKDNVKRGLEWLAKQQKEDGSIGSGADHAIAGLALAEGYGMGKTEEFGRAAQAAVDCSIAKHQVKDSGWGREPRKNPDLATTIWYTNQLKSAKIAGLKVEGVGFQGAMNFIDSVTAGTGLAAIAPGKSPSLAMTAAGAWGRTMMGTPITEPLLAKAADALVKAPPAAKSPGDFCHLYFATHFLFQMGGDRWMKWNEAYKPAMINAQAKGPIPLGSGPEDLDGSWTEGQGEAAAKSRVYATALGALSLEIYYRYLPMYGK